MNFSKPHTKDMVMAQASNVLALMPAYNEIPSEFNSHSNLWHKATDKWFFEGIDKRAFTVKDGINANDAFHHLYMIISSYQPKHEHKTAGIAYLMSMWFSDVKL